MVIDQLAIDHQSRRVRDAIVEHDVQILHHFDRRRDLELVQ